MLGDRPNQIERKRAEVEVTCRELIDFAVDPGRRSREAGLRATSTSASSTSSPGCAATAPRHHNLMEDAATAEISRSQLWQWVRHGAELDDGRPVTRELVRETEDEQLERIRTEIGDDEWFEREGRPARASREIFEGSRWPTTSWSSSPSPPTTTSSIPWSARPPGTSARRACARHAILLKASQPPARSPGRARRRWRGPGRCARPLAWHGDASWVARAGRRDSPTALPARVWACERALAGDR